MPSKQPPGVRKSDADKLKRAAAFYYSKRRWACHFEFGLMRRGRLRADVIAVDMRGLVVVVEVKSCLADLKADTKAVKYTDYCDAMYLCVSQKLAAHTYTKEWLAEHKGIGLLVLDATTGYCRVARAARKHLLDDDRRLQIMTRLAWRSADLSRRTNRQRQRIFL